jgi:hypothetical protein
MRWYGLGLLIVVFAVGVAAAQTGSQFGNEGELEQKLKALRDEIDALRKKQDKLEAERKALIDEKEARQRKDEAERKAKAAAEKKKHYAKVEIRGTLSAKPEQGGFGFPQQSAAWVVTINHARWRLDFTDKKDLADEAAKLAGKPVVITGAVVNVNKPWTFNPYQYPVQPWPQPWPQQQQQQQQPWLQPQPQVVPPQVQYIQIEAPMVIHVESIKIAKD